MAFCIKLQWRRTDWRGALAAACVSLLAACGGGGGGGGTAAVPPTTPTTPTTPPVAGSYADTLAYSSAATGSLTTPN